MSPKLSTLAIEEIEEQADIVSDFEPHLQIIQPRQQPRSLYKAASYDEVVPVRGTFTVSF